MIGAFLEAASDGAARASSKAALVDSLVKYLGPQAAQPIGYHEQLWVLERYTKGCVSPLAPGVFSQFGAALRPNAGRVIWAGSETAFIWNGYIDGAVRAGRDAALKALAAT